MSSVETVNVDEVEGTRRSGLIFGCRSTVTAMIAPAPHLASPAA